MPSPCGPGHGYSSQPENLAADGLPATAATAAATTTAATAGLTRLRFIDAQRTAAHVLAVQLADSGCSGGLVHLDEAEATGASGLAVRDQLHRMNGAELLELLADFIFIGGKR